MQTISPKSIVWLIAVILGVLGILGAFVAIPVVSAYTFWLVTAGFVLLALATVCDIWGRSLSCPLYC